MPCRWTKRLMWPGLGLLAVGLVVIAALFLSTSATQAARPAQGAAPAAANQAGGPAATPNDVNRVAKQLYCPVCPNTPLNVCETQACKDWRELIRQKLAAGASDQDVIDYFVEQYGQRVLAAPPAQGFNLLIWIIPVAALVAGLAALAVVLRSWSPRTGKLRPDTAAARNSPAAAGSPTAPKPRASELPADYVARVERELQGMRSH